MKKPSQLAIAREIGKMPYFQVHFTQKKILTMLKNNEISQDIIDKATKELNKKKNL